MSAPLGIVVPCRDEERVLERKLRNLALVRWPALAPGAAHRLLVVDDGSRDATAARARALLAALFPAGGAVRAECLANERAPGKCGALATGLARLAGDVALCVVSDADVVLEPDALERLAEAFARDARLGLACGAQRFVRDLAADGTPRGADGGPPRRADDAWDRWTARMRALESRAGRLFSVHGQLLAWRAALALAPRPGLAADDLDLMLQARARGWRVARVARARFLEVKTPRGPLARAQGLRRARAYLELVRAAPTPLARDTLDRLQWALYARVPPAAPELALAGLAALCAAAGLALGPRAAAALAALSLGVAFTPAGRRALELARWIRAARRAVAARSTAVQGGSDRWEMQRT